MVELPKKVQNNGFQVLWVLRFPGELIARTLSQLKQEN